MPTAKRPRHGSLQFYPRKRVNKFLPRVNWKPVSESSSVKEDCLLGFIGYKVGMATAVVKDNTDKSMTKGKRIALPVTILEVPNMKIFSVRFYKKGIVVKDVIVGNDKELKKKVKVPKEVKKDFSSVKEESFDDIRVIVYSVVKQTSVKKKPDLIELAVKSSDAKSKLDLVKGLIGKEIALADVMKWNLVDVRGLTKGKGIQGPVKRFGIKLRPHKSEKGLRKVGSIGPWHPARVTFRVPMAGQLGMFTRVNYNLHVLEIGDVRKEGEQNLNKKEGFKNYGNVKSSYVILSGSVQGSKKRQMLITPALRPTKKQNKKQYEFIGLEVNGK